MGISVDIATRMLRENHNVYVMRPGRQYSLFQDMVEQEEVALDLPGLDLDPKFKITDQPNLGEKIVRSRALQNWYLRREANPERPTDDLNEYRGRAESQSIRQLRRIVEGFYGRVNQKDLVVLPPGPLTEKALLGEFVDPADSYRTMELNSKYGSDLLPSRRVKWLGTIAKNQIPANILEQLKKPLVLTQVEREQKIIFYERAYKIFSIANERFVTKFELPSANYTSKDEFILQAFFSFVAFNTKTLDDAGARRLLPMQEAAFADAGRYNPSLRTNINSPGSFALDSVMMTPIIASVLLQLCGKYSALQLFKAAEEGKIKFGNSEGNDDDDLVIEVERHVVDQLRLLDLDEWAVACRRAKEALENTKLENPIVARDGHDLD